MVTMASLMATNTPTWCPTNQMPQAFNYHPKIDSIEIQHLTHWLDKFSSMECPTRNLFQEFLYLCRLPLPSSSSMTMNWTPPLTLTTHPTTVVDAIEPSKTTLSSLCNDELYDYRLWLAKQTDELEQMQQCWLLLDALFNCSQSDSDASDHLQSPLNHSPLMPLHLDPQMQPQLLQMSY